MRFVNARQLSQRRYSGTGMYSDAPSMFFSGADINQHQGRMPQNSMRLVTTPLTDMLGT